MLTPAHASGNIPAIGKGWIGVVAGCRPTILEACNYDMMPDPPYVNGCRLGNSGYWQPAGHCPLCPLNSNPLNTTTCTCNPNFVPDSIQTSCVPIAICPVTALTALTDPVAIDFENGNRWRPDLLTAGPTGYQAKLACVQNGIGARGGSSVGTSAYRPTQYQQHLFEIVDKDLELDTAYMELHPECQVRRDEITRKMGPPPGHGLSRGQLVAIPGTSRHESGEAFDLTPSGLTDAQLASVYAICGVTHTAVPGEPWHVQ